MLREANVPVRKLCSPMRSGTLLDATIVGSFVQKLLNVSVSNLTSTLGTFCIASAARLSQNWRSSSVAVQKNHRKLTFCPLLAAGADCWAAAVVDCAAAAGALVLAGLGAVACVAAEAW